MSLHEQLDRLAPLIEDLVLDGDAARRERRLLQVLVRQGVARGAELWRESAAGWNRVAGHGAGEGLPGAAQVEAVAAGTLEGSLPPDRLVIVAGSRGGRCALALVGGGVEEELRDFLEAMLVLHLGLLGPDPAAPADLADMLLAPFGNEDPDPAVRHAASAETASLFALLEEAREDEDGDEDRGAE